MELQVLRYEETYNQAQAYWAEQMRERDRERQDTAQRFQHAQQEFLQLRTAYQQAQEQIEALCRGVPAVTVSRQRLGQLEVELKSANQQVVRLTKQRQALLDQLNLVREEAAEKARHLSQTAPAAQVKPEADPQVVARLPSLEAELERCCALWLAAERRLAEVMG
jgi:chromosome segregation ATPase